MIISKIIHNQKGSTLIEAMIAIVVLTIGIFAAMSMQTRAIDASSSSLKRSNANTLAVALLETLKGLDFDDPNLAETTASPGALVRDNNEKTFTAASFSEMKSIIKQPAEAAAGTIVDPSGITYQLSWDVQNNTLPSGETLDKRIRIYINWNSLLGPNHLEMTTVKYNNISLN